MKSKNVEYVGIFDTTLRDGEQTPGVSLTTEEKLEIARQLDRLGVDVIEAGTPISSEGEKRAVREVAKAGLNAEICVSPAPQGWTSTRPSHVTLTLFTLLSPLQTCK